MNKLVVSLQLSFSAALLVLFCLGLSRSSTTSCRACERTSQLVLSLQEELHSLGKVKGAGMQVAHAREEAPRSHAESSAAAEGDPAAIDPVVPEKLSLDSGPEGLKACFLTALQEDRAQREALRQQQNEAKRVEVAAMKEGPYEKFNLRVNSMGKVLGLNDAQKQSYHLLLKQADENWKEARKLAAEPGNAAAGVDGAPQRGPVSSGRLRQLQETAQKEFEKGVQQILTASQLEVYRQLPHSAQEFQNLGRVKGASKRVAPPGTTSP